MRKRDNHRSAHMLVLRQNQEKRRRDRKKRLEENIAYLRKLASGPGSEREKSFRLRSEARRRGVLPHILKRRVLHGLAV